MRTPAWQTAKEQTMPNQQTAQMSSADSVRAIASTQYLRAAVASRDIRAAQSQFARECARRLRLLSKFQDLAMAEAQERTGALLDVSQVFAVTPEVEALLLAPTSGLVGQSPALALGV